MFFDEQRLKDVRMLRRLAKRVLEDRVQINRIQPEQAQVAQAADEGDPMQDGEAAEMDLNSDLKPFEAAGADGVTGNLLKNYRLDISFDRDRITNLDNRSGMSVHTDPAHRQSGPAIQTYDASGFYGEAVGPGGNIGTVEGQDSSDQQIQMMQRRPDLGDAF
jgi:hypothetical protein